MRTLASIQKIVDLQPIPGADKIEVATVLGWHVVVKRGEFKVGDYCVYIEVDSIVPDRPEFEFLREGKFRIRTVRLRGQISQGICFPLETLVPPPPDTVYPGLQIQEGFDVTELLGVTKYELPVPTQLAGKVRGGFPGFLPKTDETRIQAYPGILEKYKDVPFFVTEKVDGSSTSFAIKNDEFHVCSRSLDLLDDDKNSIWQVAKEMKIEEKMRNAHLAETIALQGEIVGPKIQKNTLNLPKLTILFFNAYNFADGHFLNFHEFIDLFDRLELPTVPVITSLTQLPDTVDQAVQFATRMSAINKDGWAEGVVFRPREEMKDEDLGRLSFKVINPEYLLKNE